MKRNPAAVLAKLRESNTGAVTTTAPCKIQIPERFSSRHLATLGNRIYVLGIFALIMDDGNYSVNNTCAMMEIKPSSTDKVQIDGTSYYEFGFEPGDSVFPSTDLVMSDTLTYYIYDEFIAKGRKPWYINDNDMYKLFETDILHAGVDLGQPAVLELIVSTMFRDPNDLTRHFRYVLGSNPTFTPVTIPFRSVIWNTSDTTSKLIGAYFSDAINSALVNRSERVEKIEEYLRQ